MMCGAVSGFGGFSGSAVVSDAISGGRGIQLHRRDIVEQKSAV